MKTLDEHNKERQKYRVLDCLSEPHPSGIACPKCKAELWDSDQSRVVANMPPETEVYCPECGYHGYRVV
jgi:uncharacterized protein with PIN domain